MFAPELTSKLSFYTVNFLCTAGSPASPLPPHPGTTVTGGGRRRGAAEEEGAGGGGTTRQGGRHATTVHYRNNTPLLFLIFNTTFHFYINTHTVFVFTEQRITIRLTPAPPRAFSPASSSSNHSPNLVVFGSEVSGARECGVASSERVGVTVGEVRVRLSGVARKYVNVISEPRSIS